VTIRPPRPSAPPSSRPREGREPSPSLLAAGTASEPHREIIDRLAQALKTTRQVPWPREEKQSSSGFLDPGLPPERHKEIIDRLAHELRNPLMSIAGYIDLWLKRTDIDVAFRQQLLLACRESKRIITTANNLIVTASIEAGTLAVNPSQIDLRSFLDELLRERQCQTAGRDISVSTHLSLPEVKADRMLLSLALWNLISNALKYGSEEGSISISPYFEQARRRVVIAVANDGEGIDQSTQLFSGASFAGPKAGVKDVFTGLGVGLFVVKGVAEAMQGGFWMESSKTQGTTAYLAVPSVS